MITIVILSLGVLALLITHFVQTHQNNDKITHLKADIYKYYIRSRFQAVEVDTMQGIIKENDSKRKKVIDELHENIGNKIVAAKMHFGAIHHEALINSTYFQKGHTLLDEAVSDTRQLAYNMSDQELSEFSIITALKDIKKSLERDNQIKLGIFFHGLDKNLSNELNLQLYRMVQELITNILTHAYASQVTVQLNRRNNELILTVEDDGIGFDPQQINFIKGNGFGLKGIEQNLSQIDGKVYIDSHPGHGTTVTIEIPDAA
ncbi:hypothetical protein BFP72_12735 [Reichenbachiella sp. 5M10]|uniref:sensor histidine kinase n=1 Tax=Reichenbachiella sp. 5M10 TaxID=1889772 RepID=UPI000C15DD6E|nr:ATP-binding protein [Reichenbachiella sp. 5M10]PIB36197.1 hypothetical protein BFP72_12735 [Reichenbachiella sp. 5M10]